MKKVLEYTPLALLIAYSSKLLITGTISLSEVGLIAILAALSVHFDNKAENKKILNLQEQISKINLDNNVRDSSIKGLETSIASVKLTSGFRQVSQSGSNR